MIDEVSDALRAVRGVRASLELAAQAEDAFLVPGMEDAAYIDARALREVEEFLEGLAPAPAPAAGTGARTPGVARGPLAVL